MSLPREWNLQETRGSIYGPSQQNSTCRVQHQSRGFICSPANNADPPYNKSIANQYSSTETTDKITKINDDYGIACSQPEPVSLLAECQHSSGSLFSVVSAPPMPLAELDVKNVEAFADIGKHTSLVTPMGGTAPKPFLSTLSTESFNMPDENRSSAGTSLKTRRPCTLPIDTPYNSLVPPSRTLHSSLLEHQISEIEEDDNENLLTVSSITARPLIAKSRELKADKQNKNGQKKCKVSNRATAGRAESTTSCEPPDGGYGWFIVFGAFSVQFWVAGLVKSYGVLYVEIMETFPNSTAAVASWIPAILSALCLALAPLSSALCQKYSCRAVVFVGGLFCALGMSLSYFATSLLHLLLTFGVLTGIGGGLSTTPGIVIVSQYFEKHRALANGICVSGTAAGSFILPVLIKHLADKFGFHGTILILGGCMFHVCLSAILYKPVEDFTNESFQNDVDESAKPLNNVNPSSNDMLTNVTYLEDYQHGQKFYFDDSHNRLNDFYSSKKFANDKINQESDDEFKDTVGETTFIKPMKKVRSSGILHSVEDLSTDSTWVYRKDSNRGSRRRKNVFANDEIISKIQAHLEKPLSPPAVVTRGLSKSMEIPTPVSNLSDIKDCSDVKRTQQETIDEVEKEHEPQTCCERIEMYLDISLLKDCSFILMCLSVTLMSVGCPYMLYYLPAHVISIGYNKSEAGYLVAVSAVLDLCGRLGLGWLSDLQLFDRRKTYILCILGAGIAVLTIPSECTLYLVGLSAAAYGLCLGSWYVLMPVLLADMFGTDRIGSSYGLVRLFQSIGAISVPPLAGLLRDLSGSYAICFYCMGSCMILGSLPLLAWSLIEDKRNNLLDIPEESEGNSVAS